MSAEFDAVEYVITGIGINADTQDFPDDIKEKATSIYLAQAVILTRTNSLPVCLTTLKRNSSKTI